MTKGYARILGSIAAFGIGLGLSVEAQAITYLGTFSGNDCTGGFSDCYAYPGGTNNGPIDLGSPVIIKYGSGGGTNIGWLVLADNPRGEVDREGNFESTEVTPLRTRQLTS